MSRRREAIKRDILEDPKYHSQIVAKFINTMMYSGKKSVAENILYQALELMHGRIKKQKKSEDSESEGNSGSATDSIIDCFQKAIDNVKPTVEVRSRRVGGATYQVPVEVRADRSEALAMRWLIKAARVRGEKGMVLRLTGELTDAFENKGSAVKKREDTHKMAKANQAFAHFGWTKKSR